MLRKFALTVVFLFVVCGAAAQLPDDEYYPYGTGYELIKSEAKRS